MNGTKVVKGSHCGGIFDGILCWPDTPPGIEAIQICPNYIDGFNTNAYAIRTCTSADGWYFNPETNRTWTDYSRCLQSDGVPGLIVAHMDRIRVMYNVGYGISLCSLILASAIMLFFRRLHCPRNIIHLNLFASFIFRASISFMKENLLVHGLGFHDDVVDLENGSIGFLEGGLHWQCKTFFVIFNYILSVNYSWIFVEGLYLYILLSVSVFSEKSGLRLYILGGWVAPITWVITWSGVRAAKENVLCWNTHPTSGYFWIIRGPVVLSILANFFFFLKILRLLFTKLNSINSLAAKKNRYRRLAKSTLVLIPLFGVHYIVFLGLPDNIDEKTELGKLYFEMFFNSFQGFFVALLFCFLNSEVQGEIRKLWERYRLTKSRSFTRCRNYTLSSVARDSIDDNIDLRTNESNNPFKAIKLNQPDVVNGHVQNISMEEEPMMHALNESNTQNTASNIDLHVTVDDNIDTIFHRPLINEV